MTGRIPDRPWDAAPAAATAAVILVNAALARLLLDADEFRVYVAGRPIEWVCALRKHFGVPCPTCGLTRSVVLTLHGHVLQAWKLAPGGAVAVAGGLAFAAGLLALAGLRAAGSSAAGAFQARLRTSALAGTAIILIVWLGGWAVEFAGALHGR